MNEATSARAKRLIENEVHLCVSSLVHTLAQGYGAGVQLPREVVELHEQAFELACPVPDYEEAAREAGWYWNDDAGAFHRLHGHTERAADSWQEACELSGIEPYDREVFEHWAVSRWLAEKLEAKGEKVDYDLAGMVVWARTTTGQAIYMDAVVQEIAADLSAQLIHHRNQMRNRGFASGRPRGAPRA